MTGLRCAGPMALKSYAISMSAAAGFGAWVGRSEGVANLGGKCRCNVMCMCLVEKAHKPHSVGLHSPIARLHYRFGEKKVKVKQIDKGINRVGKKTPKQVGLSMSQRWRVGMKFEGGLNLNL